uniref:Protein EARLY HEADING DATE 2 n=1 Tax=Aegilops tauschii subsp. strangulata TaxID=200361 RepID=A0A453GGZ2_AEGTS
IDLSKSIVAATVGQSVRPSLLTLKTMTGMTRLYYPSAEVIALSPRTLMATNRFVCEICHKGFQRDQNLQLHRRGHNLPWKLRQRGAEGGAAPRKRAYVCPEPACVHHDPRRALGDLTGIKKHFCRKHGEKKWKCDRCAKRYAVHSDWKAHAKVCGTREYRCDCGTLFSRRDSFVTHRAFCDALAQENSKLAQPAMNMATVASALQGQQHAHHHHNLMLPSTHADDLDMDADEASAFEPDIKSPHLKMFSDYDADAAAADNPLGCMLSSLGAAPSAFSPSSGLSMLGLHAGPSDAAAMGGCYSPGNGSLASMSATALLQKAAQMGATTSSGYGVSFTPGHPGLASTMAGLDRFPCSAGPFGPMRTHGPYDGVVGFGVGGLMPGQLYNDGDNGATRNVGPVASGADNPLDDERRRRQAAGGDDVHVVDYMGVEHQ